MSGLGDRRRRRVRRGRGSVLATLLLLAALIPARALAAGGDVSNTLLVTMERPDQYMSLDPALAARQDGTNGAIGSRAWTILANTNDGLLAFARRPGVAGTVLQPDLAVAVPRPTDGGRVYTFRIRPGVRFSTPDREVRASDVKASLERMLAMRSPGSRYYLGIVGASRLLRTGRGHASGIRANDRAGTVRITLKRANPGFLTALALPWAFVLPAGLAASDRSVPNGVPATGPYMVTRYEPDFQVVLRPNPNWRRLAPRDRSLPPRLSQIQVQIGVAVDDSLARIAAGEADTTLTRIAPLRITQGGYRSRPRDVTIISDIREPATYYFFMNVTKPPFNNSNVRRAVNLAIDRQALVATFQGQAVPTAQVLPPRFPGYRRLPIPRPNIGAARALVRRAHLTAGERQVILWSPKDSPAPDVSRIMAQTLVRIGLHVQIRYLDRLVFDSRLGRQGAGAQMGYSYWVATTPDGYDAFRLLDGTQIRAVGNENLSYFRLADGLIDRARALPLGSARNRAWARVDRAVARAAPWVPFANLVREDMVSERLRGYIYNPIYGPLWSLMRVRGP